ncbi:MAG: hypothetical protein ACRYGR_07625 [Janthinobacterium lividum]
MTYKGSKETLRPDITSQRLNLLKEIKERAGKPKPLSVSKTIVTDINQVQEKLKNTVSGSLLGHNNPAGKTLENALSFKVKRMLTKIARDEKSKNKIASPSIIQALKDDRKGIEKEVTDLCREVLIKSAEHSDDFYTFYHGHGNGLRLYFDILREIKSFEKYPRIRFWQSIAG